MLSTRLIRILTTGLLALLAASLCPAQDLEPRRGEINLGQGGALPSWVVPVLRLVSATHVEPTTGIVLAESGLVLVPADFARAGDEVIVLDGGTDLVRNGRPARIERRFTAAGLQVLSVPGLKRQGISLASPLGEGAEVTLKAFPPAELIIEGHPPLSEIATVVVYGETGLPAISGETPLPNVTGAIINACGDVAGVSVAADIQSMEPSPATRYAWATTLAGVFESLGVEPAAPRCPTDSTPPVSEEPLEQAQEPPPAPEVIEPEPEPEPVEAPQEAAEEATEEAVEEPQEEDPQAEPETEAEPETVPEILPPIETDPPAIPAPAEIEEETAGGRRWPWLLAAVLLFVSGLLLHYFRNRKSRPEDPVDSPDSATTGPGAEIEPEPETSFEAPRLDSLLVIEGVLADGEHFELSCPVSRHAVNVLIGRGDVDLRIESPAVSRRHARVNGDRTALMLEDLGSSNGSSINGVPCLEGEILYVEPGDDIVLGNARFTLELRDNGFGERESGR